MVSYGFVDQYTLGIESIIELLLYIKQKLLCFMPLIWCRQFKGIPLIWAVSLNIAAWIWEAYVLKDKLLTLYHFTFPDWFICWVSLFARRLSLKVIALSMVWLFSLSNLKILYKHTYTYANLLPPVQAIIVVNNLILSSSNNFYSLWESCGLDIEKTSSRGRHVCGCQVRR